MARTRASVGAKVAAGKSSKARCCAVPSTSSSPSAGGSGHGSKTISGGGGNPVCPQPTPKWQKTITNFFSSKDQQVDKSSDDGGEASSISRPRKRNVIESDDEEVQETPQPQGQEERPKNSVLDESIELGPLADEKSHKIEEYYSKNGSNPTNEEEDEDVSNNKDNHNGSSENHNRSSENHNGSSENHNGSSENHNGSSENQNGTEDQNKTAEKPKTNKGKGIGKKTKNNNKKTTNEKENITVNISIEKGKSMKRDLEEENSNESASKKIKVN